MSKSIKSFCAVSLLVLVAACGNNDSGDAEEFVVVDPTPVTTEPTYNSKL